MFWLAAKQPIFQWYGHRQDSSLSLSLSLSMSHGYFQSVLICFWREKKGDVFLIPLLPLLTACEWELKNHRPICFVGGIFNSILSYVEEGLTSHKVFFFQ